MKNFTLFDLKKHLAVLLIATLSTSLLGCSKEEEVKPVEEAKKIAYYKVTLDSLTPIFKISGTLKAESETTIASEVSGTVSQIFVREGDNVNKDDILLLMDIPSNSITASLETARVSLANAEEMLNLTKISTENDEKSAQIFVEQAQISLESAQKNNTSTGVSVDEQIKSTEAALKSAKTNLEISQNNLKDLEENLKKTELNLFESAQNTFSSAMVVFSSAIQATDSILGISDEHKNDNNEYERLLAVRNPTLLIDAKNKFLPTNSSYLAIKDYFNNFETYKINNNLQDSIDIEVANNMLQEAGEIGRDIRALLYILDDILQNSISDAYFTKAQLDGMKANVDGIQSSLEAQFSAFTMSSQTISDFIIKRPQSLTSAKLAVESAENTYSQAEHNLANLQAGLDVQTVNTESQVNIAQKSLESAKLSLENVKKKNDLSIQNAKTARDAAAKNYDATLLAYSRLTITSPVSGVVTKKASEVGDNINMGSMLFIVSELSSLKLEADLNSEEADQLKEGSKVGVLIDEKIVTGKIDKISPVADVNNRKVKIEIKIPNEKKEIYSNIFVSAEIKGIPRNNVLKIPLSSLITKSPPTVFLIDPSEKTIKKQNVKLGEQNGTFIEILSGLNEGDLITKEKVIGLEEGNKVDLIEEEIEEPKEDVQVNNSEKKAAEEINNWITNPTDQSSWKTLDTEVEIEGIFPKDTAKIMVNGYMLQKFNPEDEKWSYQASVTIGNLAYGNNTYVVEMFDQNDKIIATDEIEIILNK